MINQQQPDNSGYPALTKPHKALYPFKICTTSFIYPDHYIPNVKMLGPYMDEIELLLFESKGPDSLPSMAVITELVQLAAEFDLSYNVHLPTDISISDPNPARQADAVETIIQAMALVGPLDPTALILHVPYGESTSDNSAVERWQNRVYQNLKEIVSTVENKKIIAVENLNYPLGLLDGIIADLGLSICLDLGHLMIYGHDVLEVFDTYAAKTSVIHLHGVENDRDHISLERLSDKLMQAVLQVLNKFTGTVSLEVFSFENLDSSLKFLERRWNESEVRSHRTEDG